MLSFQINFYLLRLIASHVIKVSVRSWPRKKWPHLFRFFGAIFMSIFLGARQRQFWVLPDPKREHSPPLSFSCIHPLIIFLPITEPRAKQERWSRRQVISQLLSPAKGMEGHPAFAFSGLHRKSSRMSNEDVSSLSACLVGIAIGVWPTALPALLEHFCKAENVASRLLLSVLLQKWGRQHLFEVLSSSSFLVCFHLI